MRFLAVIVGIVASELTQSHETDPDQVFLPEDDDEEPMRIADARGNQGPYEDLMIAPWQVPILSENFGMKLEHMRIDHDGLSEPPGMEGRAIPTYMYSKNWDFIDENGRIRVPYYIDHTVPEEYHAGIHEGLLEFNRAVGCIEFYFDEERFHWHGIHVFGEDDEGTSPGCWSFIGQCPNCNMHKYNHQGMRDGWQPLRLPNWCTGLGGVHHEFLHALGFLHEQERPDVWKYVVNNTNWHYPMSKNQWIDSGHPFEPYSGVMPNGYDLRNGGKYKSAVMLTTTDAEQLHWLYCRDLEVYHPMPPKSQCLSPDVIGFMRPIFHHRLCDNYVDCYDGSDEDGSLAVCKNPYGKTDLGCCKRLKVGWDDGAICTSNGTMANGRDVYWCDGRLAKRLEFTDRGWTMFDSETGSGKQAWSYTGDSDLPCVGDNGEFDQFFIWGKHQLKLSCPVYGIERLQPCIDHNCTDDERCVNIDETSFSCVPRPTVTTTTVRVSHST